MALTGEAKKENNRLNYQKNKARISAKNRKNYPDKIRTLDGFITQQFNTIKNQKSNGGSGFRPAYEHIKSDITKEDVKNFITENWRLYSNMWAYHDRQSEGRHSYWTLPEVGMKNISLGWVVGNLVVETAKASKDRIKKFNAAEEIDFSDEEIEDFTAIAKCHIEETFSDEDIEGFDSIIMERSKPSKRMVMQDFINSVDVELIDVDRVHELQCI